MFKNLKLEGGRPSRPWSVVIRAGRGQGEYIIEGYGTALDRPLHTSTLTIRPVPVP